MKNRTEVGPFCHYTLTRDIYVHAYNYISRVDQQIYCPGGGGDTGLS